MVKLLENIEGRIFNLERHAEWQQNGNAELSAKNPNE
jgi:hypothetical protein